MRHERNIQSAIHIIQIYILAVVLQVLPTVPKDGPSLLLDEQLYWVQ